MLTLRDKLRSRNVDRWHTVATSIKQNIAEHSHCMGIIAEYLLERIVPDCTFEMRYTVLKYSQVHDLPELITGDPSSVFKRFLKSRLEGFDELMDELEGHLIPELVQIETWMKETNNTHLKLIFKAADLLEAYSYFLTGRGLDEEHNSVIDSKLKEYLQETINKGLAEYPEFNWRIIHHTLNEISHGESTVINFESKLDAVM